MGVLDQFDLIWPGLESLSLSVYPCSSFMVSFLLKFWLRSTHFGQDLRAWSTHFDRDRSEAILVELTRHTWNSNFPAKIWTRTPIIYLLQCRFSARTPRIDKKCQMISSWPRTSTISHIRLFIRWTAIIMFLDSSWIRKNRSPVSTHLASLCRFLLDR